MTAVISWTWTRPPAADLPSRVVQVASGGDIRFPKLSPDGLAVAHVGGDRERIVVTSLETGERRELPETDRAVNPFWSPDSREIAYFTFRELGWELRAVPARGGASRTIVRSRIDPNGNVGPDPLWAGAWCAAGIVYFEGNSGGLRLVSGAGQPLENFVTPSGGGSYAYPHCLPDGRVLAVLKRPSTSSIVVVTPTQQTILLDLPVSNLTAVQFPVMVGSSHIVFERREPTTGLWVLPVAADLSARSGEERLIVPDGRRPSATGTLLAYVSGLRDEDRQLLWVDRKGARRATLGRPQKEFKTPSLSFDEREAITGGRRGTADELWLHGQDTVKLWVETESGDWPAWSPDGGRIAYVRTGQPTQRQLVVRSVRGSDPRTIAQGPAISQVSWTPTGDALVYANEGGVWRAPLEGGAPQHILKNAREPAVSRDGRLIAYTSTATGTNEVYVTSFPDPDQPLPVSTDGGRHPRWAADGELFFACGPPVGDGPGALRSLCVARVTPGPPPERRSLMTLFDVAPRDLMLITFNHRGYDVAGDGSRILLQTWGVAGTPAITLVENVEAWLGRGTR